MVESPTANSISFTNTTDSGAKQFNIAGAGAAGNGAIVNNGSTAQQDAFQNIVLTANATIGDTVGIARFSLRSQLAIAHTAETSGMNPDARWGERTSKPCNFIPWAGVAGAGRTGSPGMRL